MGRYLRQIRRGRWLRYPEVPWLSPDGIQADALLDVGTLENKLSIYEVEGEHDVERVANALAANRKYATNLDYIVFLDNELVKSNVSIENERGETPDELANSLHRDLKELTIDDIGSVTKAMFAGELVRIYEKDIIKRLSIALHSEEIDRDKMKPELLAKVDAYDGE